MDDDLHPFRLERQQPLLDAVVDAAGVLDRHSRDAILSGRLLKVAHVADAVQIISMDEPDAGPIVEGAEIGQGSRRDAVTWDCTEERGVRSVIGQERGCCPVTGDQNIVHLSEQGDRSRSRAGNRADHGSRTPEPSAIVGPNGGAGRVHRIEEADAQCGQMGEISCLCDNRGVALVNVDSSHNSGKSNLLAEPAGVNPLCWVGWMSPARSHQDPNSDRASTKVFVENQALDALATISRRS
mmetsp:Transcript_33918/g.77512  ORF Transcript_33918/g.77512 Transcript_33918/m.77512 type:complete len:240 (+) Transcript_33918:323-1042(+)